MFEPILLGRQAELLVERAAEVVGCLEAGLAGDDDDLFVGLLQHLFGPDQANVAEFFHRGTDVVFAKGFFEPAARHGDVLDDVGHADLLVGLVVDEA